MSKFAGYKKNASLAPKNSSVNMLNTQDDVFSYLKLHNTYPSESAVLYVERLRRFYTWRIFESDHQHSHVENDSIQMSLVIPSGEKLDANTKLALDSSSNLVFSTWMLAFLTQGEPPAGQLLYPLAENVGTATGKIEGLPNGKIKGEIQINHSFFTIEKQTKPLLRRQQLSFTCRPIIINAVDAQACAGRTFAQCFDKSLVKVEIEKSDMKYCFYGINQCRKKYLSNFTPTSDADSRPN